MLLRCEDLLDILACPGCHKPIGRDVLPISCLNADCLLNGEEFLVVDGKPVLVNFQSSVMDRDKLVQSNASSPLRRGGRLRKLANSIANGENRVAPYFADEIITELEKISAEEGRRPRVLIVGGGAIGSGAAGLYGSSKVDVVAFDIYASSNVTFIADGHSIPLADASFDAVWVQAVLEHVADPPGVVAEIRRVLNSRGLLFADTPFMWPVHEKGYDYTRYTASGQRWLFRDFDVIAFGTSSGPGTALILALRHLIASATRMPILAHLCCLPFIWVRLLDNICDTRRGLDAAAGLFFYGRRNEMPLLHDGLVAFYDEQLRYQRSVWRYRRRRPNTRRVTA